MGACIESGREPLLVMEHMEHGSLYDLLHNSTLQMEGDVVIPMIKDIVAGERSQMRVSSRVWMWAHWGLVTHSLNSTRWPAPPTFPPSAPGMNYLHLTHLNAMVCASRFFPTGMNYLHLALNANCSALPPCPGMNYLHLAKPPVLHNDIKARGLGACACRRWRRWAGPLPFSIICIL